MSLITTLLGEAKNPNTEGDQLNPHEDHIDPVSGECILDDELNESVSLTTSLLEDTQVS